MTESRTLVGNVCLERQSSLLTIELSVFSTVMLNCLIIPVEINRISKVSSRTPKFV